MTAPNAPKPRRCASCGTKRLRDDMGFVNGVPFCHPSDSEGMTCYMAAQSLMGGT